MPHGGGKTLSSRRRRDHTKFLQDYLAPHNTDESRIDLQMDNVQQGNTSGSEPFPAFRTLAMRNESDLRLCTTQGLNPTNLQHLYADHSLPHCSLLFSMSQYPFPSRPKTGGANKRAG